MDDDEYNNIDITTLTEKQYSKGFIKIWEIYPELWNTFIEAYRDKVKKNSALKNN